MKKYYGKVTKLVKGQLVECKISSSNIVDAYVDSGVDVTVYGKPRKVDLDLCRKLLTDGIARNMDIRCTVKDNGVGHIITELAFEKGFVETKTVLAKDVVDVEIDYIELAVGDTFANVQKDGFTMFVAESGVGKTHFAVKNLGNLIRSFDAVIVLNYEITDSDYNKRLKELGEIPANLVYSNVRDVREAVREATRMLGKNVETVAFIVDNIDNVGSGKDKFNEQEAWLNDFDRFLKSNGYFGLVLSQLRKLDKETTYKKNDSGSGYHTTIEQGMVAGSSERVKLSRTTLCGALVKETGERIYGVVKAGTMLAKKTTIGTINLYRK